MKVFVIDAHAIYRRGLVASLDTLDRVERVDEADCVPAACEHDALAGADLVFIDVSIPGGHEFLDSLADHTPARVIACTSECDENSVSSAIDVGAIGYLRKESLTQEILRAAIDTAAVGAAILAPDMLRGLVRADAPDDEVFKPRERTLQALTEREQRVLALIAEGFPTREVAEQLAYSERTVKNVLHDIVTKLNVRSRSQAVAHAVRDGLI